MNMRLLAKSINAWAGRSVLAGLLMAAAAAGPVSAATTEGPEAINGVYLVNTDGWSKPMVWVWTDTQNFTGGSWPGVAMTKDGDYYKWVNPTADEPAMIIFSDNGTPQTHDLEYVKGGIYDCSGTLLGVAGESYDPDPEPEPDPTPVPGPVCENMTNDYYTVNPGGCVGSNKSMNITSTSTADKANINQWTAAELIATGAARDICQAFKGLHERPIVDAYGLFAAYDSKYLYLGLQTVYTVWDEGGEGFQAGESKPYNMDGKLCWAFNLGTGKTIDGTVTSGASLWQDGEYTKFDNGTDCIWFGSTKPGVGDPGLFFSNGKGKSDYTDARVKKGRNVRYSYTSGLNSAFEGHVWGPKAFGHSLSQATFEEATTFVDLSEEVTRMKGSETAHTFYEFAFPLADLGISEDYIRNYGIGVMFVSFYGASAHESLPYDPSFYDNVFEDYSMDKSTSHEKEDKETITYGHARVGRLATTSGLVTMGVEKAAPAVVPGMGSVRVDGLDGQRVIVASLDGRLLHNATATGSLTLSLRPGLYVVSVDGRATRVLVR